MHPPTPTAGPPDRPCAVLVCAVPRRCVLCRVAWRLRWVGTVMCLRVNRFMTLQVEKGVLPLTHCPSQIRLSKSKIDPHKGPAGRNALGGTTHDWDSLAGIPWHERAARPGPDRRPPAQGCTTKRRAPLPPPSRAPSLCPATVPLTPSAGLNGICNRQ